MSSSSKIKFKTNKNSKNYLLPDGKISRKQLLFVAGKEKEINMITSAKITK